MDEQVNNELGVSVINDQPIQTIVGSNAKALSDILMANIKKVQDNPGYVPQAKEIRDNVRELVNLARVEIDAFREMRKVTRQK